MPIVSALKRSVMLSASMAKESLTRACHRHHNRRPSPFPSSVAYTEILVRVAAILVGGSSRWKRTSASILSSVVVRAMRIGSIISTSVRARALREVSRMIPRSRMMYAMSSAVFLPSRALALTHRLVGSTTLTVTPVYPLPTAVAREIRIVSVATNSASASVVAFSHVT